MLLILQDNLYNMANSNQNVKALVIIALLGLFGLNVYQFVNNSNLQKDNLSKENELVQLEDAKAKLDKEYQQAVSDLNDMKTNNEELNRVIDSQKEELRIQKEKIGGLLKDSRNLALARKEIEPGTPSSIRASLVSLTSWFPSIFPLSMPKRLICICFAIFCKALYTLLSSK